MRKEVSMSFLLEDKDIKSFFEYDAIKREWISYSLNDGAKISFNSIKQKWINTEVNEFTPYISFKKKGKELYVSKYSSSISITEGYYHCYMLFESSVTQEDIDIDDEYSEYNYDTLNDREYVVIDFLKDQIEKVSKDKDLLKRLENKLEILREDRLER